MSETALFPFEDRSWGASKPVVSHDMASVGSWLNHSHIFLNLKLGQHCDS